MSKPLTNKPELEGYISGIIAVTIWAGWAIVSKLGINSNLTPFDITFLRYLSASIFLFPIFIKKFPKIKSESNRKLFFIIFGAGAPYMFITAMGFSFAPSAHSILIPSNMPVFYALIAFIFLKEVPDNMRKVGLILITLGGLLKLYTSLNNFEYLAGDMLFIVAAFVWAAFTYNVKQTEFSPFTAASYIAVGSVIIMAVPYVIYQFIRPHSLHISDILFQLFYQGVVTSIISMVLYNHSIRLIGAARTTSLTALVPLETTIFSYLILNEVPSNMDLVFVTLATIGVLLCSGIIKRKKVAAVI